MRGRAIAAPTEEQARHAAEIEKRAKAIIASEDYAFTGRYKGNVRAGIPGDLSGAELPYCCWIREDGTGFVTERW